MTYEEPVVLSIIHAKWFQLFWEGQKNVRNFPHGFDIYLVNVKTMRKIAQIFVAFSEKLKFTEVFQKLHSHIYEP